MSHDPAGSSPGIGIPQLAACLLIGYLFFRWYSSTPPPPNAPAPTPPAASRRPTAHELARLQQRAEVVRGMFPQISLSAIKWELQKNGGSVEITTEKILAQGFLPEPPVQEISVQTASTSRSRAPVPAAAIAGSANTPKQYTDLITRYNLSEKLTASVSALVGEGDALDRGKSPAWSQNKAERQALLQKRREDMILKARRRVEGEKEKERAKATHGS